MKRSVWLFVLASMMAVGCEASEPSSGSNTSAQQSDEPTTAEVGQRSNLRDARYCEVIVVTGRLNEIEGAVYNTIGLNDCPAEQWEALDPEQLKEEFRANEVVLNGPRYFMMDENALVEPGEVASFEGLEMRHLATIQLPAGSLIGDNLEGRPYTENTIERETEYVFRAGQPVYELISPDEQVYVMQSYSQMVDPALTQDDLSALGDRLDLSEGWRYRVRELDEDFTVLTTGGLAHVIQDDLKNTYQRVDE
jgi:hypothetical protein